MLIGDYADAFIPHRIELICAHCHKTFLWFCSDMNENSVYSRPKYCSKTHKSRAKEKQVKKVKREGISACPNPEKRKLTTPHDALRVLETSHYGDVHLRPYRCECGFFHNGHSLMDKKMVAV